MTCQCVSSTQAEHLSPVCLGHLWLFNDLSPAEREFMAELLEARVIDQQGKFNQSLDHPHLRQGIDGFEYVLVWGKNSLMGEDIAITEVDLDNLIRAKGAMYAGYVTLLESVGITFADLHRALTGHRPRQILLSWQRLHAGLSDQPHRPCPLPGADDGKLANDQYGALGKRPVHGALYGLALSAPHRHGAVSFSTR